MIFLAIIKNFYPHNIQDLKDLIQTQKKILLKGAGTSTVVPFSQIDKYIPDNLELFLVSFDQWPKKLELKEGGFLEIAGPVSWEEARTFLDQSQYELPLWPTETSAYILSGLATSASGERSFKYGPLKKYVHSLSVMNDKGEILSLSCQKKYEGPKFKRIQDKQEKTQFKNSLIFDWDLEIDPYIGSEGQLGIILSCRLQLVFKIKTSSFFVLLDAWDRDHNYKKHAELQKWSRGQKYLMACEMLDHHSLKFVGPSRFFGQDKDLIFFEIEESFLENTMDSLLKDLPFIKEEYIGQIPMSELIALRLEVPRKISDFISHHKLSKMGTDIQINSFDFEKLFILYQDMAKNLLEKKQSYLLFGHFGDCHLHFNILPDQKHALFCQELLENLYKQISVLTCMPFAEHGIGLLKQRFLPLFLSAQDRNDLKKIKNYFDPNHLFNPLGHMSKE